MKPEQEIFQNILNNIKQVIFGKDEVIEKILLCWISGGHVLLEDVPGTGKTVLARALAQSTNCEFKRVQFTPDLLPSDIIGASVFNQKDREFEFHPGPIFTSILLGDEINRATPRTQSALLEVMSEKQITVEGVTRKTDPLFFTIATQNPIDHLGTFQLPEAQLDRFAMKLTLGYPTEEQEIEMAKSQNKAHPLEKIGPVESHERIKWLSEKIKTVKVSDEVYEYVVDLVNASRVCTDLKMGAGPRTTLALIRLAQAKASFDGKDYVKPVHVFSLIDEVMGHRLILTPEAKLSGLTAKSVLQKIKQQTKAPVQAA